MNKRVLQFFVPVVFAFLLTLGIPNHSFAQGWYDANWRYRKAIVIDYTKVPNTDQSDFPVLVSLTSDADLIAHARSDGFDILFTSGDGVTKIPYQRESYASGTLVAWVKVPTVSHAANTFIYMYYGYASAGDQEDAANVWTNSYAGIYHLDEPGAGTSGEYKDAKSPQNNGTVSETVLASGTVLRATYSHTPTGNNDYCYQELTTPGDYTVVTGDVLVYDVYWTSNTDQIAIDLITFNDPNSDALRNYPSPDQNGVGAHPAIDLTTYALNKWYRRVIPLPASLVGKTIRNYDIACEWDGTGTKTGYLSNIYIMNGSSVKVTIYAPGGNITNALNFSSPSLNVPPGNPGYTVSFTNVSNPSPTARSVTGKIVNAVNADATRFVGMGASATTQLNNWTLEAWVYPNNVSQHGYFVINGNDAGGYGIGIGNAITGSAGNSFIGIYGGVAWMTSGSSFSTASMWYHVVMARDAGGTARFYLNGSQTANTYATTPNAVPARLTIANELNGNNIPFRFFNGIVDEVRISSAVRSSDWVMTEYNNQSSPSAFYAVETEICHVTATVTATQNVSCYDGNDGKITITAGGGTPDYLFSIDNGGSWTADPGKTSHTFENLTAGSNYQIRVKDSNGCLSPEIP